MADRSATNESTINSSRSFHKDSENSESEGATGRSMNTTTTAATLPLICRFFLRGHCAFGERCYYIHDNDPAFRNNSSQRNRNMSSHSRRMNNKNQVASNNINTNNTNQPSTSGQNKEMASKSHNSLSGMNDVKHAQAEDNSLSPKITTFIVKATESNNSGDEDDDVEGACSPPLKDDKWVNAPEFVPKNSFKPKSYATAVNPLSTEDTSDNSKIKLCPYAIKDGLCKYPEGECVYLHGDICDLCGCAALHPYNEELRKKHNQECIEQHEKDMELSFAIARSKEKTCGVCFEVIMEKASGEQRFGILPNCNHCFCLSCIRKWRQARQFENNIIRACPECRVTSDFVCPSMYWVDTKEDKDKLILDYKEALAKKDCKYFKKGSGKCPFGNKCFYLHALADGSRCDVGPPPRQRRRRTAFDNDFEVLQQVILWDFLDGRDNPWQSLADDIEDLVELFTDSDESDWSDYDIFID